MCRVFVIMSFMFLCLHGCFAQEISGKVTDTGKKSLAGASIVVVDNGGKTVAYTICGDGGRFSISLKGKDQSGLKIEFMMLGYEKTIIPLSKFRQGQSIVLKEQMFTLKEVSVRPDRIKQRGDTLDYSVAMFKQTQDRSIADVIRKLPGLEVSSNGSISYEGRPINKFYIEGMDLMGSKYAQASENLQADKVKTVQVVQNHQPVKSLRGVQFSEQAALNIVLKEDAKNVWSGVMDIGGGSHVQNAAKFLYDSKIMVMMFSKKMQNLSMYKCNNTGKDITYELRDLATMMRDNQEENGILDNISVTTPNIGSERSRFNETHVVATNQLFKTSKDNDLRVQADYLWDRKHSDFDRSTSYTDISGAIVYEESATTAISNQVKADLTYKVNNDNIYLNNRLHGNLGFDRSYGMTSLNGTETRRMVRPRKSFITEDSEIIRTTRNGNSMNFSSQTTFSYLPGQLLTVLGETEKLDIRSLVSMNSLSFRQRIGRFTVNYRTGADVQAQQLDVRYGDTDASESYNEQNFYIAPSMNLETQSLKMVIAMKANLAHRAYADYDNCRLTLQPRASLNYHFTSALSSSAGYSYQESENSLMSIYRTPIFTSYRTQASYSGKPENRGMHSANINASYKNPIKGIFFTASTSWSHRTNEMLFSSKLTDNVYLRTPTDQRYDADTYSVRARFSKSFFWAKTSISLNASKMWSDYALLFGEQLSKWQLKSSIVQLHLAMQPVKAFSFEIDSEMNASKQSCKDNTDFTTENLVNFAHKLSLFVFPAKGLELSIKGSAYHSSDKDVPSNFFIDSGISYKAKCIEYSLHANNILGNMTYERQLLTTNANICSVYSLRPREIVAQISFDLF